ncbi:bifunctional hydroxymethylpyrimidine kinase/phosphomethylpyrimidine kinase [Clostridium sp. D2Q-11]|uniref:Hydroxymethylpyrimidine/phosphomethylpyrimidine kinase n=1 Tax=Anaeromonas frigoriresistens TaxID=2683708 RepID=A0A942Z8T2_9FIRM|nr:bifunctional hydroxymethylpyrimidine kinase/phosphomethylpyrimidine kinase [Anaeromonas frigoriresistens]MBS4538598.1 bifunctional hydroxymethylpyrimidine kinase/phosphomethylpyrimidine kinase [Anaeromonas frigoriresistens]
MKKVLTIAGSDSCGGAGIQADIKTMDALGVYGMSVICAVTAQNTMGVEDVQDMTPDIVRAQIDAIFTDIEVDAVKIGMVSSPEIIRVIKERLIFYKAKKIVVDPVMVSKSGYHLLKKKAIDELKGLISIADIVTPNIPEAEVLTGLNIITEEDMKNAAKNIIKMGVKSVLIKGGHRCNDATDILLYKENFLVIPGKKIDTENTHGTGCTLSSSIASQLAKGFSIKESVILSKKYITKAIENSFALGKGVGPVGHLIDLYKRGGTDYGEN